MTADFPKLKLSLEGEFIVESAPEIASFPLTWLTSNDRATGRIMCKKNLVVFSPSLGDPVMYKITSYDYESRRFIGQKI